MGKLNKYENESSTAENNSLEKIGTRNMFSNIFEISVKYVVNMPDTKKKKHEVCYNK